VSPQTNREGTSSASSYFLSSPSSSYFFEDEESSIEDLDLDNNCQKSVGAATNLTQSDHDQEHNKKPLFTSSMSFFLKISFSLFLVICIVHVAHPLNGASQSQDPRYGGILQYSSAQRRSFDGALVDFEQPRISVYLRDFAGKVIKEFPTDGDNTVTLPEFKVEDHLWQGKAIVLECFSSKYPVLWEYRGVGVC
jgi:hypothetical protein